ncbi:MAG TPA: 2OG-Fe(II) oxygenase [Candidatus Binataceae bacterium]|nr:2OG-Fe(II) oxygenase [Candidatus Binataceae bacterium]
MKANSEPNPTVLLESWEITKRVARLDWDSLLRVLAEQGFVVTPPIIEQEHCAALSGLWEDSARFRKQIDMARQGFGLGSYKYFAAPLPDTVQALRTALYARLLPVANRWQRELGLTQQFPAALDDFIALCHRHGQTRPTPLLLRYETAGYNCLHQDLYGEVVFPLQATVLLSCPERDYRGGEFLLLEDRPRAQARGWSLPLSQGSAIIFASARRPRPGRRGYYRVRMRHGVSPLHEGVRFTLGLIFHDAR